MIKTLFILSMTMLSSSGYALEPLPGSTALPEAPANELSQMQSQMRELSDMLNKIQTTQAEISQAIANRMQEDANKNNHWISHKDSIPAKERINANLVDSKNSIYICQATFGLLGLHPGQIIKNECMITYGGKQIMRQEYNVLTSKKSLSWRPSAELQTRFFDAYPGSYNIGQALPNQLTNQPVQYPVIGGHEKNHSLFICRGIYNNEMHVGKVVGNSCNIAGDNKEIELHDFEVLFN